MKQVFIYKNGVWDDVCNCNVKTYFQGSWVDSDYNNVEKYTKVRENNVLVDLDCKNGKYIRWGYLYNGYAQQDTRNIANPTNGWRFPNNADLQSLTVANGTTASDVRGTGYYSKQIPILKTGYFRSVSDGNEKVSTNAFNFTALPFIAIVVSTSSIGSGNTNNYNGLFILTINEKFISPSTNIEKPYYYFAVWSSESSGVVKSTPDSSSGGIKMMDYCHVRLCRDLLPSEIALADGTYVSDYVGNDGKTYKAVKIDNRIWMAEYLCETIFANGNTIVQNTTKNQVENTAWINTANIGIDSSLWSKNSYCIPNWFTIYNSDFTDSLWFTNDIKFNIV